MTATENKWRDGAMKIRRYSLRIDGFVSLHAQRQGAEITSKPLSFSGDNLSVNISTPRGMMRHGEGLPQE